MKRFMTFVGIGLLAAMLNIGLRGFFSQALRFELSVALAYPIAMTVAFLLSKKYVFEKSATSITHQYWRFALVNVFSFIQVWLVSVLLARFLLPAIGWAWHMEMVAHMAGVGSPILTSYLAHKRFSFK